MKIFLSLFLLLTLTFALLSPPVSAQLGLDRNLQPGGLKPAQGNSAATLGTIIKNLVTLFYSLGAVGFTIMIIWGAVDWILSGGDKEKVGTARKRITTAIVGLFLLALSFPIIGLIAQISGVNIFGDLPLKNLTN